MYFTWPPGKMCVKYFKLSSNIFLQISEIQISLPDLEEQTSNVFRMFGQGGFQTASSRSCVIFVRGGRGGGGGEGGDAAGNAVMEITKLRNAFNDELPHRTEFMFCRTFVFFFFVAKTWDWCMVNEQLQQFGEARMILSWNFRARAIEYNWFFNSV